MARLKATVWYNMPTLLQARHKTLPSLKIRRGCVLHEGGVTEDQNLVLYQSPHNWGKPERAPILAT